MKLTKLFACIACCLMASAGFASSLTGAWRGELTVMGTKLPLVFNFSDCGGATCCTLDSPMQGAKGIPTEVTYCSADSIRIEMRALRASFSGRILPGEINGTFSQSGMDFPLRLTPEESAELRRPQTPRPPFPYFTTDTTFTALDGVTLAGTLTLPATISSARFPAVVMVSGSGPQNRDEEIYDHRPFAVIADYLARHGIASFRYDDRGTAKSGGNFATSGVSIFKGDAAAALNFLRTFPQIGKAGLLGHSEGGTIAMQLASEGLPDFAISLAGALTSGKEIILAQNENGLKHIPMTDAQRTDALKLISLSFDKIIAGEKVSDADIDVLVASSGFDINPLVLTALKQNLPATTSTPFREMLSINPALWLGKVACPVFAVNGSLDSQVSAASNLQAAREQLPADVMEKSIIKEYPGLNHLLQHATTGEIQEYEQIRETLSEELLQDLTTFIQTLP